MFSIESSRHPMLPAAAPCYRFKLNGNFHWKSKEGSHFFVNHFDRPANMLAHSKKESFVFVEREKEKEESFLVVFVVADEKRRNSEEEER